MYISELGCLLLAFTFSSMFVIAVWLFATLMQVLNERDLLLTINEAQDKEMNNQLAILERKARECFERECQ